MPARTDDDEVPARFEGGRVDFMAERMISACAPGNVARNSSGLRLQLDVDVVSGTTKLIQAGLGNLLSD
jgi:hypothetical protein